MNGLDDFCIVVSDHDIRPLTKTEQRILLLLWRRKNHPVTSDMIIDHLYRGDPNGGPEHARKLITVYIFKLRKKLADTGYEIRSQYGVGYRLIERPNSHLGQNAKARTAASAVA